MQSTEEIIEAIVEVALIEDTTGLTTDMIDLTVTIVVVIQIAGDITIAAVDMIALTTVTVLIEGMTAMIVDPTEASEEDLHLIVSVHHSNHATDALHPRFDSYAGRPRSPY